MRIKTIILRFTIIDDAEKDDSIKEYETLQTAVIQAIKAKGWPEPDVIDEPEQACLSNGYHLVIAPYGVKTKVLAHYLQSQNKPPRALLIIDDDYWLASLDSFMQWAHKPIFSLYYPSVQMGEEDQTEAYVSQLLNKVEQQIHKQVAMEQTSDAFEGIMGKHIRHCQDHEFYKTIESLDQSKVHDWWIILPVPEEKTLVIVSRHSSHIEALSWLHNQPDIKEEDVVVISVHDLAVHILTP